jgi:hypothetical protein
VADLASLLFGIGIEDSQDHFIEIQSIWQLYLYPEYVHQGLLTALLHPALPTLAF